MTIYQTVIVCAALLCVLAFGVQGCREYGEVNQETFGHATALYSACNQKNLNRLETCAQLLTDAVASDRVSSTEANYLAEIIAAGRKGNWEEAQAMARQLMTDQAGR